MNGDVFIMNMVDLERHFFYGDIAKKAYWGLMREKLRTLCDVKDLLGNNIDCEAVEIRKEGIILVWRGIKLWFDFSSNYSRAEIILTMRGDYEQEDFDILSKCLPEKGVVFDIGGNVGLFSLIMAHMNPQINIFSFEPVPDTYDRMLENLLLNVNNGNRERRIHTFNIGMSNEPGDFTFYVPGNDEASSMRPVDDDFYLRKSEANGVWTCQTSIKEIKCTVTTVDRFCDENNISDIALIKLDVEGAERDALLGAKATLTRVKPIVYCEMLRKHAARFGYHPNDIIRYMDELGYDCFTLSNHVFSKFSYMDEGTKETNFFFLNREHHKSFINELCLV